MTIHGRLSLSERPAVVRDAGHRFSDHPVPLRTLPRLLLVWLSTETVRTKERRLVADRLSRCSGRD